MVGKLFEFKFVHKTTMWAEGKRESDLRGGANDYAIALGWKLQATERRGERKVEKREGEATSGSSVQMIQLYCNRKRARRLGWGEGA
jgi:hypothetical protein